MEAKIGYKFTLCAAKKSIMRVSREPMVCVSKWSVVAPSVKAAFGLIVLVSEETSTTLRPHRGRATRSQYGRARTRGRTVFVSSDSTHAYYRRSSVIQPSALGDLFV